MKAYLVEYVGQLKLGGHWDAAGLVGIVYLIWAYDAENASDE